MYSDEDTRCRVGCPIRISTDQRLLAAPRGFSQRATSFIASWCQGIHRMPFLYSISLPGLDPGITMHRNHPQSHHRTRRWCRMILEIYMFSAHTTRSVPEGRFAGSLAQPAKKPSDEIVHRASEPSLPTVGGQSLRTTFPVRQFSRTTRCPPIPQDRFPSHAPRDAPEPDSHV